jgi:subtilisin family serine protease
MKTGTHLLSILLITTLTFGQQLQTSAADAANGLLVKWKDGPNSLAAVAGNAQIGSTVKRNFNALGWQLIELPAGMAAGDGIKAYQSLGTVAHVEPDGTTHVEPPLPPSTNSAPTPRTVAFQPLIPNDPLFSQQWNMRMISATNAWSVTTGGTNIVVAILDSGVDYTHPELAPNMWRNPGETGLDANGNDRATNGIDDDINGYVDDVHGVDVVNDTGNPMDTGFWDSTVNTNPIYHGTFIAGIIGAVGNNGVGVAGLNWSVQMMAIRHYGGDFAYQSFSLAMSYTLAAWDYVLTMKRRGVNIRISNNSYANYMDSMALREAIAAAGREGILSVCSAGNYQYDEDLFSGIPRTINEPSIISVANSDESDALAASSNFGRSTVHLAAPGRNLTSTWKGSIYGFGWGGTSFACPHVVGAAALLLAMNPNLTVDDLKAALLGSVDQPASLRGKLMTNGRLDVARALDYLTNANPPAIVITALPAGQRTPSNAPIQVTFNRSMNRASVESAFVLTPLVTGIFEWTDDNRSFAYHHEVPFDSTTNYIVRILGTAQDGSGETLDGDFDRTREGSPGDDFVWTFRFPIPNDDFENAQLIAGASGSLQSSNRYATFQLSEPDHLGDRTSMSSVWYRWSPPETGGWVTFDLSIGTAFDSLLAVYNGDALDQLVAVAGNDNEGTRTISRLSFPAVAGTNYSVVVAGKSADVTKRVVATNQAGPFTLQWYRTPPPVVRSFTPTSAYPGQVVTLNGTNFTGATRVLFNGVPAQFTLSTNAAFTDLQLTVIVPAEATTGLITIETPHGNFTTTNNFTVLARPWLAIQPIPASNLVEVSWPSAAFSLQRADSLTATTTWSAASIISVRTTNGIRYVTVTNAAPNRFFRLHRPTG